MFERAETVSAEIFRKISGWEEKKFCSELNGGHFQDFGSDENVREGEREEERERGKGERNPLSNRSNYISSSNANRGLSELCPNARWRW